MASRPKKSSLLLVATRLANLDEVDQEHPVGAAYKAVMIRVEVRELERIAAELEGVA